jgi:hypothetical protein
MRASVSLSTEIDVVSAGGFGSGVVSVFLGCSSLSFSMMVGVG